MRRKAFLMGMAVLAGLPTGVSAKVFGKMDRGFHSYDAKYGATAIGVTSPGQEAAEPSLQSENAGNESVLYRFKGLLNAVTWSGTAGLAAETRGWQVEMLQPRLEMRLSENGDPRLRQTEPLGLRLRYTF